MFYLSEVWTAVNIFCFFVNNIYVVKEINLENILID